MPEIDILNERIQKYISERPDSDVVPLLREILDVFPLTQDSPVFGCLCASCQARVQVFLEGVEGEI